MSSEEPRKVSIEDIKMVQNIIEMCLLLYMSKNEIVSFLSRHAKVEPGFTEVVWQKLQDQNPEFFKAYHVRLILKDQISRFNELLEKQVELMKDQTHSCAMTTSIPQTLPMNQEASAHHAPLHSAPVFQPENMHSLLNTTAAGGVLGLQSMQHQANTNTTYDIVDLESMQSNTTYGALGVESMQQPVNTSTPYGILDVEAMQSNTTCGALDVQSMQHPGNTSSAYSIFDVESMQHQNNSNTICGALGVQSMQLPVHTSTTYGILNVESMQHQVDSNIGSGALDVESMQNPVVNSSTTLGQIPRNRSFSDLTGSDCLDILERYTDSTFLATNTDNLLDLEENREQQDFKLEIGGKSFEDFANDWINGLSSEDFANDWFNGGN